jgi:hypothetical protein
VRRLCFNFVPLDFQAIFKTVLKKLKKPFVRGLNAKFVKRGRRTSTGEEKETGGKKRTHTKREDGGKEKEKTRQKLHD